MKTTLLAAAAVLALGIGSAFAGEAPAGPQQGTPATIVNGVGSFTLTPSDMAKLSWDTGSQQMPAYASIGVPVRIAPQELPGPAAAQAANAPGTADRAGKQNLATTDNNATIRR